MFPSFRLTLLTLFFSIVPLFSACTTSATPPKQQGGFVWEATKDGEVLTLVGTMHLGIREEEVAPIVWSRLESAELLITEADLSTFNRDLLRRYMVLPAGKSLEEMLGKKDFERARAIIKEAFPYTTDANLRSMTPLALGTQLMMASVKNAAKDEKDDPSRIKAVDTVILEKAEKLGKKMAFFETLDEQLTRLEKALTLEEVRRLLDEVKSEEDAYRKLREAYLHSDPEAIKMLIDELPQDQRDLLLDARNRNWIAELDSLKSKKHTFIAVGAAHFGGPDSLLLLLEKRGYKIRSLL